MTEKTEKQNMTIRPPVVVVLGHVDHGKSSLLEAIREDFRITKKEAGGITQHIGAYQVEYKGKSITLIDTPGHEAFSAMRSRGAKVADIAILVVAADEGVKTQTKEAIKQIKKAELPTLVAINKIDKPQANVERIKQELSENEIAVESYGGDIPFVETSATTKKGITELLDMILLLSEMEDLKADNNVKANGIVIESNMDSRRGVTATLLVKEGTLKVGDIVGTGTAAGKVRIMEDFQGGVIENATPSTPVRVLGFENTPQVGEEFNVFSEMKLAQEKLPEIKEEVINEEEISENVLPVILIADVAGSLEAVKEVLERLPKDKITLKIISLKVGEVGENDVKLAKGVDARILAFNTKIESGAKALALRENIKIENFNIIYELEARAKELLEKSLEPEIIRKDLGVLEILAIFRTEKVRQIIGGKVIEGEIQKGSKIEIIRDEEVIGSGKIVNLQKAKKDVSSVSRGEESGMVFEGSVKVQEGDKLQFFIEEKQEQTL